MGKRERSFIFEPEGYREKKKGGGLIAFLLVVVLLLGAVYLYNRAVNSRVTVSAETVKLVNMDSSLEGFRVLVISDLSGSSLGSNQELWTQLLKSQKWDAAVLCGDMVGSSGNNEPMLSLIHTLQVLRPDAPVYFVAGDGDPDPVSSKPRGTPEVLADWVLEAQANGAIYLDAPVSQTYGKKNVWFSPSYLYDMDVEASATSLRSQLLQMEEQGKQYEMESGANYRALSYRLDVMDRTLEAMEQVTSEDLQIAVNHMPLEDDYLRNAITYADKSSAFSFRSVSLVISGHPCGGQYRLPWGNAIRCNDQWFPTDDNVKGLNHSYSTYRYISPGLSSSSEAPIPVRLFNPPEVCILKFMRGID